MAISIIRREWVIDHVTPTSVFLPAKDGRIGAGQRHRAAIWITALERPFEGFECNVADSVEAADLELESCFRS